MWCQEASALADGARLEAVRVRGQRLQFPVQCTKHLQHIAACNDSSLTLCKCRIMYIYKFDWHPADDTLPASVHHVNTVSVATALPRMREELQPEKVSLDTADDCSPIGWGTLVFLA